MSNRIGDLTPTSAVAWNDLFEKETDSFGASNKINAADLRTGLFAGGTGFANNDPLVVGPITVNTNKFLVDVSGNVTIAGTATIAGAATHNAAVTINAGLTVTGAEVLTNSVNQIVPGTGTSKMYWEMVNTGNTVRFGSEGAAGGEGLAASSAYSLIINSVTAGRSVQIGTENTIRMTIRNTGIVDFSNSVTVPTNTTLFFDGGGNTGIKESASDVLDLIAGGSTKLQALAAGISVTGTIVASSSITGTNMVAGAGNAFIFTGRSQIVSLADSRLSFVDNANATFTRFTLGLESASFPSIKRNGTDIELRLGDDSARTSLLALNGTFSGNLTVTGNTSVTGTLESVGKQGYGTGAGGTVTQTTSRNTAVTINKLCGTITTDTTSATGGTFTVNNSTVSANDTVDISFGLPATANGILTMGVRSVQNGSFVIFYNGAVNETAALTINFKVNKVVTS